MGSRLCPRVPESRWVALSKRQLGICFATGSCFKTSSWFETKRGILQVNRSKVGSQRFDTVFISAAPSQPACRYRSSQANCNVSRNQGGTHETKTLFTVNHLVALADDGLDRHLEQLRGPGGAGEQ